MRKRAKFNLSNFHNCTFKMGNLYPVCLTEVLPGDSMQMSTSVFMRLAPQVAPVMHPVYMSLATYLIPSRVLADQLDDFDFETFITGGPEGIDTQTIPQITLNATNSPVGSLADAFGIPVQMLKGSNTFKVNALPFLAYYMIWNDYYRDQDLNEPVDLASLVGTPSSLGLMRPSWAKDYFTTARPWAQKGPEVSVPVNLTAAGQPTINATTTITGNGSPTFSAQVGNTPNRIRSSSIGASGESILTTSSNMGGLAWSNPALAATTSIDFQSGNPELGSVNINNLRESFALQRFEEHRGLFGSRYEDYLRYLGVRPQDARLQMPEYLGGFSAPVQFSEVLQTAANESGSGVGDMAGHGIGATRGRRIRRSIPEHGYVLSVLMVRPIPVYSQGLERLWSKQTRMDFWQKEFEHIGQQQILNSELYADGTAEDSEPFGYQNRYDEYRRGVNIITGEFRTNQDFWTMARIFDNRPVLNGDFIECVPTDRIFQVAAENSDQCYAMVKNNIICKRLVSRNGNPI
nr:MAG TPA: Major capsid protein [Microviridae sp.]